MVKTSLAKGKATKRDVERTGVVGSGALASVRSKIIRSSRQVIENLVNMDDGIEITARLKGGKRC